MSKKKNLKNTEIKEQQSNENKDPKQEARRERRFRYWTFVLIEAAVLVLLNILARIPAICDWYTDHIFGWWSNSYARLTGLIPASFGEIMIYVAVGLVVLAVLGLIGLIIWGRYRFYRRLSGHYYRFLLVFVLTVGVLLTLNLSFLYKTSKLNLNGDSNKQYSTEQLELLRNYIVEQANTLSAQMARDELGYVILGGQETPVTQAELQEQIHEALHNQTELLPRLYGYYPPVKTIASTKIMYYIYTTGVYLPHTMEANMSALVDTSWYAYTAAHELSHLKGYIYEDEANFVAYAALVNTDDPFLQYCAYLGVLDHVDGNYWDSVGANTYKEAPAIQSLVRFDDCCYTREDIDRMEAGKEDDIIPPTVITDISVNMTDTYLDYYDSTANYDEVTKLLLQYYDGILY